MDQKFCGSRRLELVVAIRGMIGILGDTDIHEQLIREVNSAIVYEMEHREGGRNDTAICRKLGINRGTYRKWRTNSTIQLTEERTRGKNQRNDDPAVQD